MDSVVGREAFLFGGFDTNEMHKVFTLLSILGYQDFSAKTFVDIGANIGTTTLPAIMEWGFKDVIAFEPDPINFNLLQQNSLQNHVSLKVHAYNLALSDREAILDFELSTVNAGDHRIRIEPGQGRHNDEHLDDLEEPRSIISVEATTFYAFILKHNISIDNFGLVWIDTQGHEGQVLEGAKTLTSSNVPVLIEYWPYALNRAQGLSHLETIIMENYSHFIDIRKCQVNQPTLNASSEIARLKKEYIGPDFTDLLLFKKK